MRKVLLILGVGSALLAATALVVTQTSSGQNVLLKRLIAARLLDAPLVWEDPDVLRVFVCGSASPLGVSDRAQSCIVVAAGSTFFIVDTGAGSTRNLLRAQVPMQSLTGVLFTHFHSDHISALGDTNLASWVAGRTTPLNVYGPRGVVRVVDGFNEAYVLDRTYRTMHHGSELLPPEIGAMQPQLIVSGKVVEVGEFKITPFSVDHGPVEPAVGYRFDYRGRSVVISGDTNAVQSTAVASRDADLLLHDALSRPLVDAMKDAVTSVGNVRIAQVIDDILDYHADTDSLIEVAREAGVTMLALYHLVPAPANTIVKSIFGRGLPADVRIVDDGTVFNLAANTDAIEVVQIF
mgnify:FL=1